MKKLLLSFWLLFATTVFCSVKAQNTPPNQPGNELMIIIQFRAFSPEILPEYGHPRTDPPQVGQTDHMLYFLDETAVTLNIYSEDENGNETLEYTTAVPATTTEVQLPSTLSGTYIIEVVRDNLYFRGEIEL